MPPSDLKEIDNTVGMQSILLEAYSKAIHKLQEQVAKHDERFEKMVEAYHYLESRIDGAEAVVTASKETVFSLDTDKIVEQAGRAPRAVEAEINRILDGDNRPSEPIRYNVNDYANLEQKLGDYSSSNGWHILHPSCPSWPKVRELRQRIVAMAQKQGIFSGSPDAILNSCSSAVWKNVSFKDYRDWVARKTGDPFATPAVAGLDPWSYIDGLEILAGPAEHDGYLSYFNEIHQRIITVARKPR